MENIVERQLGIACPLETRHPCRYGLHPAIHSLPNNTKLSFNYIFVLEGRNVPVHKNVYGLRNYETFLRFRAVLYCSGNLSVLLFYLILQITHIKSSQCLKEFAIFFIYEFTFFINWQNNINKPASLFQF